MGNGLAEVLACFAAECKLRALIRGGLFPELGLGVGSAGAGVALLSLP